MKMKMRCACGVLLVFWACGGGDSAPLGGGSEQSSDAGLPPTTPPILGSDGGAPRNDTNPVEDSDGGRASFVDSSVSDTDMAVQATGNDAGASLQARADLAGPTAWDDLTKLTLADVLAEGRGIVGGFVGEDGNGYVAFNKALNMEDDFCITKLDPALGVLWKRSYTSSVKVNVTHSDILPAELTGTRSGQIFLTGKVGPDYVLPGETAAGGYDILLAEYSKDGDPVWARQIGSSDIDFGEQIALDTRGRVLVSGFSPGQLPGQPAAARSQPFFVRYTNDGTRELVDQFVPDGLLVRATSDLAVDSSDNVYQAFAAGSVGGGLRKMAPDGTKRWEYTLDHREPCPSLGQLAVHPSGDRVYSSRIRSGYAPGLTALSSDGSLLWYRSLSKVAKVVDAVEGVEWRGTFYEDRHVIRVSADSIYIAGTYAHSFVNGSVQRHPFSVGFVARYDLEGEQVWFKQFAIDNSAILKADPYDKVVMGGLDFTPAGDLFVVAEGLPAKAINQGMAAIYALRLSAEDGHRL